MEPLILDCDNTLGILAREIDDGLALLYLLGRGDVDLLGLTTTFGNGTVDEVYTQTRWLLDEAGHGDIPLLRGEAARGAPPTEAAEFLAATAAARPGEVTVLATGPLGNLHAAAQLDPAFFHNVRRVICMGGTLRPLKIGWRTIAELNLSANPEASAAVLSAPCPVALMSAQLCLQAPFRWRDLPHTAAWKPALRRAVRNWLLAFGLYCGVPRFYLWDLVPAVYVTDPALFSHEEAALDTRLSVLAEGRVQPPGRGVRARVMLPATIIDVERFRALLFDAWATSAR